MTIKSLPGITSSIITNFFQDRVEDQSTSSKGFRRHIFEEASNQN